MLSREEKGKQVLCDITSEPKAKQSRSLPQRLYKIVSKNKGLTHEIFQHIKSRGMQIPPIEWLDHISLGEGAQLFPLPPLDRPFFVNLLHCQRVDSPIAQ